MAPFGSGCEPMLRRRRVAATAPDVSICRRDRIMAHAGSPQFRRAVRPITHLGGEPIIAPRVRRVWRVSNPGTRFALENLL